MKVKYTHENPGSWNGNIMWPGEYEARGGIFPTDHPCAAGTKVFAGNDYQAGDSETLRSFRERGYWASCFPEGDGITLRCKNGQCEDDVIKDIEQVFGWKVVKSNGQSSHSPTVKRGTAMRPKNRAQQKEKAG